MARTIKVLVVDDSAFMRKAISNMLSSDPEIEVIGTASNGKQAIVKVKELQPDVVTLDVEMPYMDGITALRHIMNESPVPVLMVSSVTEEGAKATLQALDLGAIDFIPKQLSFVSLDIIKIEKQLKEKVKAISTVIVKRRSLKKRPLKLLEYDIGKKAVKGKRIEIVAIGTSTGGPGALQEILTRLPGNLPAGILVVQHMPATFTNAFANRLDSVSALKINEANGGEELAPGMVYIAPGGRQMTISRVSQKSIINISDRPRNILHKPSVDVMMLSVAKEFGGNCAGIILTGMGNDGLEGIKTIHKNGGKTIAEAEETCVVYGMPKVAIEAKVIDKVIPVHEIASEIVNFF